MNRPVVLALVALLGCSAAMTQQQVDYSRLEIKTTDLGNNVYLLNWRGGDSLFLVGEDGVLLVDTAVAPLGEKIKAAIARVTSKPV